MTRTLFLAAAMAAAAAPLHAQAPVRTDEAECRSWGDDERYCETREYLVAARGSLDIDAGQNGGISVTGWDRNEIRVVAHIQAHGDDEARARELARSIAIEVGETVRAEGPARVSRRDEHWSVSYEVQVPRSTRLRLEAHNGGIRLEDLGGEVDARTLNGGIAVHGGAGRIRGHTTNGGLRVELTGATWRGDGLDLESTNGGVTIRVPEGYSAELETGTVNGGIDLDFPVTVQGRLRRTIRTTLGEDGPLIRALTTNGGVSIERN
jgi:hypothetical protein